MSDTIKKLALSVIAVIFLSRSDADALTEKPPQIASIADVVTVRNNFLKVIWGPHGWPVRNRAALIGTFDPRDPNQASKLETRGIPTKDAVLGTFTRAEELSVKVSIDGHSHETWAYHLLPSTAPNNRLVILHHGHGDSFASAEYGFNEPIARFLKAGYAVLAMYMPNYGPAPRKPSNVPNGDRHNPIFAEHKHSSATLRIFLEPIAACMNYLRAHHSYLDVNMIGLSGGGWTTVVYAAVDPTIRLSANVSGSLPLDLLSGGYLGDGEQSIGAIYRDVAGYRDLYTLAAYGRGRKHIQILYEKDPCCFSDVQWDRIHPKDRGGLAREINAYKSDIQSRIRSRLSGQFKVARHTDNSGLHKISADALDHVFDEIKNNEPESSALFFYDSKGRGTRSVLRANGAYQHVGVTEGLATDWTDIVAVKNENLFYYRRTDGLAATARLLNDGSYRYVGSATNVGAGWTHLASVGSQYLFFYNKSSGTAKIGQIDATGNYSQVGPALSGFSTQWTHVAGVKNGGLFFLDADAGTSLTARVDSSGYKSYAQVSGLATTWTSVTAVNSNALFFYNAPAGIGATALLDEFGAYVYTGPVSGGLPIAASHVTGTQNGALFFLKTSDSTGATWLVDELGGARPVQDLGEIGPWIKITGG
jgi:pimeloyl-ACP methyl ester carboxylesterase